MTTVNAAFGGVMETKIRAVREAEQTVARVSARAEPAAIVWYS